MRFHRVFIIALLLALAPMVRGQTFELLHSFNLNDGANPAAGLIQGTDGNYYGVTPDGVVYKIAPDGDFSVVATNAGQAVGALLQASDGKLYGTNKWRFVPPGKCFLGYYKRSFNVHRQFQQF